MKILPHTLFFFLLVTHICFGQWYQQNSGTSNDCSDVWFLDNYNGFVIGDAGTILHTNDSGATWTTLSSGTSYPLNAICFVDNLNGWIVGGFYDSYERNSIILHTSDGGIIWTTQMTLPSIWLLDVCFLDTNTGFAAGDAEDNTGWYSALLKTTNGGLSWSQEYDSLKHITRMQFVDSNTGWILVSVWGMGGGYQKVYKTEDAGNSWSLKLNTWETIHGQGPPLVFDIHFRDSSNGIAIGEAVYCTTDGGDTWIDTLFLEQGRAYNVSFVDADNGTAVGEGGSIYRTTDGGVSWNVQASGTLNSLNSVFFTNLLTGWAVGDNGTILYTTDGGVSFVDDETTQPTDFILFQNYPNPFNPVTKIKYTISALPTGQAGSLNPSKGGTFVQLTVYDILGREVKVLVNEEKQSGAYEIEFDGSNLPSGVYLYRLTADNFSETKKFVLLK